MNFQNHSFKIYNILLVSNISTLSSTYIFVMIYFSHLNKIIQRNERAFPLSSRIYSAQLQPDKQTVSHSNICSPTTLLYARFFFARFRLHCVLCCPLNYAIPCGRFTPQKISRRIFLGICVFLNDSKLVFGRKTAHGVSPQPKHCTVGTTKAERLRRRSRRHEGVGRRARRAFCRTFDIRFRVFMTLQNGLWFKCAQKIKWRSSMSYWR